MHFAAGSMGPKIASASAFVLAGGTMAGIGRLEDARAIVEERAGTRVQVLPIALDKRRAEKLLSAAETLI
jgi:carbamate kinase